MNPFFVVHSYHPEGSRGWNLEAEFATAVLHHRNLLPSKRALWLHHVAEAVQDLKLVNLLITCHFVCGLWQKYKKSCFLNFTFLNFERQNKLIIRGWRSFKYNYIVKYFSIGQDVHQYWDITQASGQGKSLMKWTLDPAVSRSAGRGEESPLSLP